VAQEDTAKLSKRAQRRKALEEGAEPETGAEGSDEETGAEEPPAAEPVAAKAPEEPSNRKGRRTAAAKARALRKRERAEASAIGLDASEIVDDAFVRVTDKVSRFLKKRANTLQWVIVLGVVGWLGWEVYQWQMGRVEARSSDYLFEGVQAENGRVGDPEEKGKADNRGIIDPSPIYKTHEERLNAALKDYEEAALERPSAAPAAFALLGKGGVLLELGKNDEALAAYEAARASPASEKNDVIRAGALEGIGLAREGKNDLEGAQKAFEELQQLPGYEPLAMYQRARIKDRAGDKAGAKELLNKVFEKLGPPPPAGMPGVPESHLNAALRERAAQLAGSVDPTGKEIHMPKPAFDSAAIQEMIRQMQQTPPAQAPAQGQTP
jgi:tetratricopeptide (TPR) repeat protein